ncbi:diacylglycerol kinase family protein [Devosia sp. YIM 151766]|uniref:diacylglycerol/lipid kinase family protein n=1 Tax=Devosia sp. YIM 151766 TaxID=3017325 RepID=UPI00255C4960|nr:diacylglycerol kinase family protein [Devosia sp. YIM 151766]WIY51944.1 diacylglycerol kinase family protein [Devosia sp. YIM 151766]
MRFRAILNRDGGTLRTMDLADFCRRAEEVFSRQGHDLECRVIGGDEVEAALAEATGDAAVDVMLAGGGDGTISAAAAAAYASGKPLAVLPAGTMNLFARALDMPMDLDLALAAIARGRIDHIDIATANGRPFVHQFGVGIHARLVRIRNGMVYRDRVGKMMASLRAIVATAVNPPRFLVELIGPDGARTQTVSGVAISNNPLDDGPIPVAARLDSGLLGVYVAAGTTGRDLLALALDVFTGRWRDNALVSEAEVPELVLRFPKRRRGNHAVIDGELIALDASVTLKMHPRAMPVVRPGEIAGTE